MKINFAIVGKAVAPNPVCMWNDTTVRGTLVCARVVQGYARVMGVSGHARASWDLQTRLAEQSCV